MCLELWQGKSSPPDPAQQFALLPGCSWFLQEHQERLIDLSGVNLKRVKQQSKLPVHIKTRVHTPVRLIKLNRGNYQLKT